MITYWEVYFFYFFLIQSLFVFVYDFVKITVLYLFINLKILFGIRFSTFENLFLHNLYLKPPYIYFRFFFTILEVHFVLTFIYFSNSCNCNKIYFQTDRTELLQIVWSLLSILGNLIGTSKALVEFCKDIQKTIMNTIQFLAQIKVVSKQFIVKQILCNELLTI